MKNQDLFSLKDKSKKNRMSLLQFLFDALRVKGIRFHLVVLEGYPLKIEVVEIAYDKNTNTVIVIHDRTMQTQVGLSSL